MPALKHGWRNNLIRILALDKKLLDILACPVCKGPLVYDQQQQELICKVDRLAYPIRDDIPVMLEEEARQLPAEEDV
jgi:uncharacterized protein YbaR (Trm112 family)